MRNPRKFENDLKWCLSEFKAEIVKKGHFPGFYGLSGFYL